MIHADTVEALPSHGQAPLHYYTEPAPPHHHVHRLDHDQDHHRYHPPRILLVTMRPEKKLFYYKTSFDL